MENFVLSCSIGGSFAGLGVCTNSNYACFVVGVDLLHLFMIVLDLFLSFFV